MFVNLSNTRHHNHNTCTAAVSEIAWQKIFSLIMMYCARHSIQKIFSLKSGRKSCSVLHCSVSWALAMTHTFISPHFYLLLQKMHTMWTSTPVVLLGIISHFSLWYDGQGRKKKSAINASFIINSFNTYVQLQAKLKMIS